MIFWMVAWMAAGCSVTAVVAVLAAGMDVGPEVLLGMLGPLVVTSTTWVLTERTYKRNPEALTSLMVKAFGAKFVFFGAYVSAMVALVVMRPIVFVVSFTGYFIALHLAEAWSMRRLFNQGT